LIIKKDDKINFINDVDNIFYNNKISKSIDKSTPYRKITEKNYDNNYNQKLQNSKNSNNLSYSEISNITKIDNSSAIVTTSDIDYNYNKTTTNYNYKNSERSIDKENNFYKNTPKVNYNNSFKNKINLKLNNKNLLKKNHNKKISINISSIQSPDHKAIYKIEKVENHENGEIKYDGFGVINQLKNLNKNLQKSLDNNINYMIDHEYSALKTNRNKDSSVIENEQNKKIKNLVFDDYLNYPNQRFERNISYSPLRNRYINTTNKLSEKNNISAISNSIYKNNINFVTNKKTENSYNNYCNEYYIEINHQKNNKQTQDDYDYSRLKINKNCSNNYPYFPYNEIDHNKNLKTSSIEIGDPNFKTPIIRKSRNKLITNSISNIKKNSYDKNFINKNFPITDYKNFNKYRFNNIYNPKLNYLRERYGDKKFGMLIELLEKSDINNETLNDNELLKNIVGEDYKIAKSFLKNISNESCYK
jgi:hypothetical protein